ncbi:MAG: glucokinase [Acidobacteriota bacterium]
MILAGDVGGTKVNLAISELRSGRPDFLVEETYASRDFPSLDAIVSAFLADEAVLEYREKIDAACFGIAGPVTRGRVKTTNLPWEISAAELSRVTGIPRVHLLNDLEATAEGIAVLPPSALVSLQAGDEEPGGTRALIAAGTGLGEAILAPTPEGYRPLASEGGHTDFGPRNETEIRLLQHLLRKYDHVSYERVLSGPGLVNIYEFLLADGASETPGVRARIEAAGDPAAVISTLGLMSACRVCRRALELFVGIYGAEAGNLALKAKATGGLYLGGGIAPKIRELLTEELFLGPFLAKGRMRPLLERIPVRLILEPKTALLGAAAAAFRSAAIGARGLLSPVEEA